MQGSVTDLIYEALAPLTLPDFLDAEDIRQQAATYLASHNANLGERQPNRQTTISRLRSRMLRWLVKQQKAQRHAEPIHELGDKTSDEWRAQRLGRTIERGNGFSTIHDDNSDQPSGADTAIEHEGFTQVEAIDFWRVRRNRLQPLDRTLVRMIYGLDGMPEHTYTQAASANGIPRQAAQELVAYAIDAMSDDQQERDQTPTILKIAARA